MCRLRTEGWNGPVLSKRHNAADGPFLARPQGAAPMRQLCVVALEKGLPFPASHALIWRIGAALNVTESMVGYTRHGNRSHSEHFPIATIQWISKPKRPM